MKQIKITRSESRKLQERFQVGDSYVSQVLRFQKNGPTAERIRRAAIEMGGRFVDPNFVPNCRTSYANGYIIQTFSDDVVLRIDRLTGFVSISHRGNVVETIENATMAVWNAMALKAQGIAEAAIIAR